MASILLLDSLATSAASTSKALTHAGHGVRAIGLAAELAACAPGTATIVVVREHPGESVDQQAVRSAVTLLGAARLLVLAPSSRWVSWIRIADRVLPSGVLPELVVDAVRQIEQPRSAVPAVLPSSPQRTDAAALVEPVPQLGIPGYRILKPLGRGGMSTVYLARHDATGESRVLKLLPISEHDGGMLVQRLINEAALLAQLRHPGIVRIHEQGFTEWHAFIAMEYVPCGELTALLGQPMPPALVVEIVLQVAEALGAIHRAGMVHRDLKPANILRRADGSFVLVDFGISRMTGVNLSRSGPGNLVGTAAYVSPESIGAGTVDHRSDLYALGVLFFEMLTGRKPFEADHPMRLLDLHLEAPVPRLPRTVAWAQNLLEGLMAKQPKDRFAGADTFISAVLHSIARQQEAGPETAPGRIEPQSRSHADAG